MSDRMDVRLSEKEWQHLQLGGVLPPNLRAIVSAADPRPGGYLVRIPHECIEELRGALTENLAAIGFDDAYELTDDGRMLEDLIDRFDR